jgi:ADP-heptose:LPS heptosyltransferase
MLADSADTRRVGIAWRGRASHRHDRARSAALADFLPLAGIDGVTLFSLQVDADAAELDALGPIRDVASQLHDFADTAAAISALDLVISVDTAVAHLAGALAHPAWVLLPAMPDWRWMLDREDSPWYPTMRLVRQDRAGDWAGPIADVAARLAAEPRPSTA